MVSQMLHKHALDQTRFDEIICYVGTFVVIIETTTLQST